MNAIPTVTAAALLAAAAATVAVAQTQTQSPTEPSAASSPHQRHATDNGTSEAPAMNGANPGAASTPHQHEAMRTASKADTEAAMKAGATPKTFVKMAAEDGMAEVDLAKLALGDSNGADQKRITIQQILDNVTKYYNVRLSDLQSKKRHKSIAFPRQVCMYLARRHTRYSLEEIGGYFGGRDHTTVLHAVRTVGYDVENDREIAKQLTQLETQLVGA